MTQQLDAQRRQYDLVQYQSLKAKAQITALGRVAQALAQDNLLGCNVKRLQKTVSKLTAAEISMMKPEQRVPLPCRIAQESQGIKTWRHLPIPETRQKKTSLQLGPLEAYL